MKKIHFHKVQNKTACGRDVYKSEKDYIRLVRVTLHINSVTCKKCIKIIGYL